MWEKEDGITACSPEFISHVLHILFLLSIFFHLFSYFFFLELQSFPLLMNAFPSLLLVPIYWWSGKTQQRTRGRVTSYLRQDGRRGSRIMERKREEEVINVCPSSVTICDRSCIMKGAEGRNVKRCRKHDYLKKKVGKRKVEKVSKSRPNVPGRDAWGTISRVKIYLLT